MVRGQLSFHSIRKPRSVGKNEVNWAKRIKLFICQQFLNQIEIAIEIVDYVVGSAKCRFFV